jgi:hypothetical protein
MEDVRRTIDSVTYLNRMAQYFNRPVPLGTVQLDVNNIKWWVPHFTPTGDFAMQVTTTVQRYASAKAAGADNYLNLHRAGGTVERIPTDGLDVYVLVDPASSEEETKRHSRFAAAAVGLEKGGPRIFLLGEYAKNAAPQVNLDAVLDMYLGWRKQFRRMGVESVGYQATIPRALVDRARVRGITTLRLDQIEKIPRLRSEGAQEDRIRYALSALFESGVFHCRRDHHIFIGEVGQFGIRGTRHDLLDAISNGPIIWGTSRAGHDPSRARRADAVARARRESVGPAGY